MEEIKILFVGPMGAGKTTAIFAISDIPPLATDVANSDQAECAKQTTTVALDYGELNLGNGQKVKLFGAPGQERFDFLWRMLMRGALGVVVLIDNGRPDPLGDLARHLAGLSELLHEGRVVVGIGRTETHPSPALDEHAALLQSLSTTAPIFTVDVRRRADVLLLLDALLYQIEATEEMP